MMTVFTMLGASFTLVLLLMVALWIVYLFQRRADIVDIGWGVSFIITAWAYFFLGVGNLLKMMTITAMVTIWAGRLTWHLIKRFRASREEDPRYTHLRERWGGDRTNLSFLILFVAQGVLVIILSLPFFLVNYGSWSGWNWWEFWGIIIWAIGVIGETFADKQLEAFHQDPANVGKVCNKGWWRFSRHPNYFFEFIVWVGFAVFAIPSSLGWLAVISPIIILILLIKVSGIPLAEAEALRTKGDAYREYQERTSAFIPWFPL